MVKKRILLAEDDEDDQQLFIECLQSRIDIKVLPIAENGVALMDYLDGIGNDPESPDLIILDQNMPKQNGLETLQLLKQDSRYSHIPIVIYSTYADETLIKTGIEAGACLVVSKPVSRNEYNRMINSFFERCMSV